MNSSFHAVIANLNISLRNPVDRGDGEQPHCYVRADELAALIQCAVGCYEATNAIHGWQKNINAGCWALEACDK